VPTNEEACHAVRTCICLTKQAVHLQDGRTVSRSPLASHVVLGVSVVITLRNNSLVVLHQNLEAMACFATLQGVGQSHGTGQKQAQGRRSRAPVECECGWACCFGELAKEEGTSPATILLASPASPTIRLAQCITACSTIRHPPYYPTSPIARRTPASLVAVATFQPGCILVAIS
jgi:hypothetical protein